MMNDTHTETAEQARDSTLLNLWVPRMKIKLRYRERVIYARLLRFRFPISARKLATLFNGLTTERPVSRALKKLKAIGLVKQFRAGWEAVPASTNPSKFEWPSNGEHPFYFTLVLLEANPFPGKQNALELLGLYFYLRNAESRGRENYFTIIAQDTGMTRKTVSLGIRELEKQGFYDGRTKPQTWKNAIHSPDDTVTETRRRPAPAPGAGHRHPLLVLLGGTTHEAECLGLIDRLTKRGVSLDVVIKDVEGAIQKHKANGHAGEGSALVQSWLQRRLEPYERADGYRKAKLDHAIEVSERQREAKERCDAEQDKRSAAEQAMRISVCVSDRVSRQDMLRSVIKGTETPELLAALASIGEMKDLTVERLQEIIADPSTAKKSPSAKPINESIGADLTEASNKASTAARTEPVAVDADDGDDMSWVKELCDQQV